MSTEHAPGSQSRRTIAFLIRSLDRGGAERQLVELAKRLDASLFDVDVLTFYPGGPIGDELAALPHVRLQSLFKRGRWDTVGFLARLVSVLRAIRPAILHCYLTEPSILGLIAGRLAGVPAVVWGIRASNIDYAHYGLVHRITFRIAAILSRGPDLIVANSAAGRRHAVRAGFCARHFVVVPNGIDTDCYRPCAQTRVAARQRWGIGDDDVMIGIAARLNPIKGYETFLSAAAKVAARSPHVRFVCMGAGPAAYAAQLRALADDLGLGDRLTWLPEQAKMSAIYPGLDIVCSSSRSEGFSNTIGEAMSCAVPCVVTDVGHSAQIVGRTGYVVRPESADALADGLLDMAALSHGARAALGEEARQRIVECFGTDKMVHDTTRTYFELEIA